MRSYQPADMTRCLSPLGEIELNLLQNQILEDADVAISNLQSRIIDVRGALWKGVPIDATLYVYQSNFAACTPIRLLPTPAGYDVFSLKLISDGEEGLDLAYTGFDLV